MSSAVKVKLFGILRLRFRPWEKEISLDSPLSLKEFLEALEGPFPGLKETLFSRNKLQKGVIILKNGRNIFHLAGLDTKIFPGDVLVIFPPGAGG